MILSIRASQLQSSGRSAELLDARHRGANTIDNEFWPHTNHCPRLRICYQVQCYHRQWKRGGLSLNGHRLGACCIIRDDGTFVQVEIAAELLAHALLVDAPHLCSSLKSIFQEEAILPR